MQLQQPYTRDTTLASQLNKAGDSLRAVGIYDSAIFYYQQADQIYEKLESFEGKVTTLNKWADALGSLKEYNKAIKLLKESEKLALKHLPKNHFTLAENYGFMAIIMKNIGDLEESINLINKALSICKMHENQPSHIAADLYNNLGNVYRQKALYIEAIDNYQQALSIRKNMPQPDQVKISNLLNAIATSHMYLSHYKTARKYAQESLQLRISTLGSSSLLVAESYNDLGAICWQMDKLSEASSFYQKALNIRLNNPNEDQRGIGSIYYNLGLIYYTTEEYSKALTYIHKAYNILQKTLNANHPWIANCYEAMASCSSALGQFEKAIEYHTNGIDLLIRLYGDKYPDLAYNYNNIATAYWEMKRYEPALDFYKKAIATIAPQNTTHGLIGVAKHNMGIIYLGLNQYDKAEKQLTEALEIKKASLGSVHNELANTYYTLGNLHLKQKLYTKALDYYQQALISNTRDFNDKKITANPSSFNYLSGKILLRTLSKKALAASLMGHSSNNHELISLSENTFRLCNQLIKKLRRSPSENDKISMANVIDNAFQDAVLALTPIDSHKKKVTAFQFSEKSRAAILLQAMNTGTARHYTGVPGSIIKQEEHLKQQLNLWQTKLNSESDSLVTEARDSLFSLSISQTKLENKIKANYPKYYELKYNTETTSLKQIREQLDESTALIEYFMMDTAIYTFTVTTDNLSVDCIKLPSDFNNTLQSFIKKLTFPPKRVSHSDISKYIETSNRLYSLLIAPSLKQISPDITKLIIIPDDQLHYLNFGALTTPNIKTKVKKPDYSTLPYVIDKFSISYAVSATLWAKGNPLNKSGLETARKTLGAFAPNYGQFSIQDSTSFPEMVFQLIRNNDMPLPGAQEEVKEITNIAGGEAWTGNMAQEGWFKKKAKEYSILHLAMHAIVDDSDPLNSSFVFTKPSESNDQEDGYLYASELYAVPLNANLVVLSACNSGYGKLRKGEGIMNLARAFMYSGCRSQVMSLWKVSDFASREIMTSFYKELKNGYPIDEALRRAQLHYLNNIGHPEYSHPFYWASFVPIGKMTPISLSNKSSYIWLLIPLPIFFILILLIVERKSRGRHQ